MRLLLLMLLFAAPGLGSAQSFAGGCRAEGEELVCTALLR